MPEEFGTVNLKRPESREIEMLRRHYRSHRDSLARLIADAPSEHLAGEYQRLISEIDAAILKLDELEGKRPGVNTDTNPALRPSAPGTRPLVRPTEPEGMTPVDFTRTGGDARTRIAMIVVAGVIVLGIIGWLIWRASSERKPPVPVVEQPIGTTNAAPPPAVTPAPVPAPSLVITPAVADYGLIRKGTRAVRQFEITNSGDAPVEIEVARSACRCLFYDYTAKLPPKGKESITVTIDAARARVGALQEVVAVQARKEPTSKATFEVRAVIR